MKKKRKINQTYLLLILIFVIAVLILFSIKTFKYKEDKNSNFTIVANNLQVPWEIVILPNEDILITERPGKLTLIKRKVSIDIEGVKHIGEGGLLGLAIHPDFEENNLIYIYFTSEIDGKIENRVERYVLDLEKYQLKDKKIILDKIPAFTVHDGGRIDFGPDKKLYITTGDAGNSTSPQNTTLLSGKLLRLNDDGTIPEDNPYNNAVYSYGHRNSQGITWDLQGNLYSTEHGRSGTLAGLDEINIIKKGENYGWPIIQGSEVHSKMITPIINSGEDTWAPADAVYYNNKILFTGLRGEAVYAYDINSKSIKTYFKKEYGRLRAISYHEGYIYLGTSNLDGRGLPKSGDDKIIRINASVFD